MRGQSLVVVLSWALALVGCGTPGPADGGSVVGPMVGPVAGELAFPVVEQLTEYARLPDGGPDFRLASVAMLDRAGVNFCPTEAIPAFKGFFFVLRNEGNLLVPGRYPVGLTASPLARSALFFLVSSNAVDIVPLAGAIDGGVSVTNCSGSGCAGSFEVLMLQPDGGTSGLSGAFDAPALSCP